MRINEISHTIPTVWFHSTEEDATLVAKDFRNHNIDPTGAVKDVEYWFSDDWEASRFYGPNTVVAKLSLKKPLLVSSEEFRNSRGGPSSYWAKKARSEGYDSVIIFDIMDGDMFSTVCAVFSDKQIKAKPYSYWDEETQDFILYE